jgi:restriction system protein
VALYLIKGGSQGEHEGRFLSESRIYLGWHRIHSQPLDQAKTWEELTKLVAETFPEEPFKRRQNWVGKIWYFALGMQPGDWIVMPRKFRSTIAIGEIKSELRRADPPEERFTWFREVKWLATEVPRSSFDQDLLYSFGAYSAICKITRNDAENRVRAMAKSGWKAVGLPSTGSAEGEEQDEEIPDLERLAADQLASLIQRRFTGHGLTRLVNEILRAQGYVTHMSPPGSDKGIDILAAPGALGFDCPRLCVQVKSGDSHVDHPTYSQLLGSMTSSHSEHGLLVSWAGFKAPVEKENLTQFFKIRLWNQDDLIRELLSNYSKLSPEIKAELPLKQIWVLAPSESE